MYDYQRIIDKYYPEGSPLRDIYLRHCRSVASLALRINECLGKTGAASPDEATTALSDVIPLQLDAEEVEAAAMLHDIGIFLCNAPSIECRGSEPYLRHGILGADLLRREGAPEAYARVAERHTGAGISREEIIADDLPLPTNRILMPESPLERLICYADKFYSKSGDMERKTIGKVLVSMTRFGPESYRRFQRLHCEFGDCLPS